MHCQAPRFYGSGTPDEGEYYLARVAEHDCKAQQRCGHQAAAAGKEGHRNGPRACEHCARSGSSQTRGAAENPNLPVPWF